MKMNSRCGVYHLLALCLLPWVVGDGFLEPHLLGNVEYFDDGDERYGIVGDRLTFDEARSTCVSMNGSLLELQTPSIGEFIGRALTESAVGFSSLWIGGKFFVWGPRHPYPNVTEWNVTGHWHWLSGTKIPAKDIPADTQFPMTEPPFWLDRPSQDLKVRSCLIVDRNMHHRPLVTGLPCDAKRPSICTMEPSQDVTIPLELTPSFSSEQKTYHLFRASMTWMEARRFCRSLDYKLAVVTEQDVFIKMQQRMKRNRPIMESAWIGGAFKDGMWMWVDSKTPINTGAVIPSKNGTNVTEEDKPPWYRPDDIIGEGCLLADRHLCDYFVFVEARCDRRRNVLCERSKDGNDDTVAKVPETPFFISQVAQSWDDAQHTCKFCLGKEWGLLEFAYNNAKLFKKQVQWTYLAMTLAVNVEIRHLWLNGKRFESNPKNEFTWGATYKKTSVAVDPKKFSNTTEALLPNKGDNGFVLFCPEDIDDDPFLVQHRCLNMDRENQKHFFMYGLKCHFKQHFICMNPKLTDLTRFNLTVMHKNCSNQVITDVEDINQLSET